jgi:hypothetical protein
MGSKGAIGRHFILSDRSFLRRSYLANRTAFPSVAGRGVAHIIGAIMQRSFMLSLSAVVMIYAGNATAESSHLKGTYGFTGSDACVYASGGFNARHQALGYHLFGLRRC